MNFYMVGLDDGTYEMASLPSDLYLNKLADSFISEGVGFKIFRLPPDPAHKEPIYEWHPKNQTVSHALEE